MKRIISLVLLLTSGYMSYSQINLSENKELPRSVFMSFRNVEAAKVNDKTTSENFSNLAGEWKVKRMSDGLQKNITLPAANELNGLGEMIFTDAAYSFLKAKPEGVFAKPGKSETYAYTREFSVPFDYMDRMVYITIGAAKSAVRVYINGEYVGYSTDSRNPAEFDISKFVKRGLNSVEIQVDQYTEGSYLENQSEWNFTGLNRDIYIFAQPKIRVRDFTVRTSLDPTYANGLLETATVLKTELLNTHNVTVYYDLFDPQGNLVNQASKEIQTSMRGEDTVRFTAAIQNVKLWNNETPNLYTIMYRVKREGRFTEYVTFRTGFRTIEIADGKLMLNGKPLVIRGVNYAEFSPSKGSVLSKAEMRETIQQMKYAGLNAIRTDGYPMPADFYDLCDEIGMYVCDVANINAQGVGTSIYKGKSLANDPQWLDQFKYRVDNMYQRNKTHASVIMWGLGDNAGNGYNMYETYLMLKAMDQSRPVVYNGGGLEFNSEIFCPDYPDMAKIEKIRDAMDGQPIVFSRCKFDPAIWKSDFISGGFIERWDSPSLLASGKFSELGKDYKLTTKGNGSMNLPSAKGDVQKIQEQFAPIVINVIDEKKGIYEFVNKLDFTNLSELNIICETYKKGKKQKDHILNVVAAPGESAQVTIPGSVFASKDEVVIMVGNLAKYSFK